MFYRVSKDFCRRNAFSLYEQVQEVTKVVDVEIATRT